MLTTLIVTNIITVLVSFYFIRSLILKNERYEELAIKIHNKNAEYVEFIADLKDVIIAATTEMREIDSKGIFEKDDHVGFTFQRLVRVTESLEDFIKEKIQIGTDDEEENEK